MVALVVICTIDFLENGVQRPSDSTMRGNKYSCILHIGGMFGIFLSFPCSLAAPAQRDVWLMSWAVENCRMCWPAIREIRVENVPWRESPDTRSPSGWMDYLVREPRIIHCVCFKYREGP